MHMYLSSLTRNPLFGGFGPGPTQNGLYSNKRRLEEVEEGLYFLCSKNKSVDEHMLKLSFLMMLVI